MQVYSHQFIEFISTSHIELLFGALEEGDLKKRFYCCGASYFCMRLVKLCKKNSCSLNKTPLRWGRGCHYPLCVLDGISKAACRFCDDLYTFFPEETRDPAAAHSRDEMMYEVLLALCQRLACGKGPSPRRIVEYLQSRFLYYGMLKKDAMAYMIVLFHLSEMLRCRGDEGIFGQLSDFQEGVDETVSRLQKDYPIADHPAKWKSFQEALGYYKISTEKIVVSTPSRVTVLDSASQGDVDVAALPRPSGVISQKSVPWRPWV